MGSSECFSNLQFYVENVFVQLQQPKIFFQMNPWQHLKKSLEQIQSYDLSSLAQIWAICTEQQLVWKNHQYNFQVFLGLFYCKKMFKNPYSRSIVIMTRHFWVQNGTLAQRGIFLIKTPQN